jgi:hypothetical protein
VLCVKPLLFLQVMLPFKAVLWVLSACAVTQVATDAERPNPVGTQQIIASGSSNRLDLDDWSFAKHRRLDRRSHKVLGWVRGPGVAYQCCQLGTCIRTLSKCVGGAHRASRCGCGCVVLCCVLFVVLCCVVFVVAVVVVVVVAILGLFSEHSLTARIPYLVVVLDTLAHTSTLPRS